MIMIMIMIHVYLFMYIMMLMIITDEEIVLQGGYPVLPTLGDSDTDYNGDNMERLQSARLWGSSENSF